MNALDSPYKFLDPNAAYWPAALATTLMLYKCYVPGGSLWNVLGYTIWFFVVVIWLAKFLPIFKKKNHRSKRSFITLCILFCVSLLSLTRLPCEVGLITSVHQFETFMRQQKPVEFKRRFLESPGAPVKQVGIYSIYDYSIKEGSGSAFFVTSIYQYLNVELDGFAYKPHQPSEKTVWNNRVGRSFTHLWGDWYLFHQTDFF